MIKSLKRELYGEKTFSKTLVDQKVWSAIDLQPDCAIRNKLREPLSTALFYLLVNDLMDTLQARQRLVDFSFGLPPEHLAEPLHTDASAQSLEELD